MFPRFREQLGTALDVIVEFSTLGEYRLAADLPPGAPTAPADDAPDHAPQLGGAGDPAGRAAGRHTVAGGATGETPVATPAARRLLSAGASALDGPAADPCRGARRLAAHHPRHRRAGAAPAPEQLCFLI